MRSGLTVGRPRLRVTAFVQVLPIKVMSMMILLRDAPNQKRWIMWKQYVISDKNMYNIRCKWQKIYIKLIWKQLFSFPLYSYRWWQTIAPPLSKWLPYIPSDDSSGQRGDPGAGNETGFSQLDSNYQENQQNSWQDHRKGAAYHHDHISEWTNQRMEGFPLWTCFLNDLVFIHLPGAEF